MRPPGTVIAGDEAEAPLIDYHLSCPGADQAMLCQVFLEWTAYTAYTLSPKPLQHINCQGFAALAQVDQDESRLYQLMQRAE